MHNTETHSNAEFAENIFLFFLSAILCDPLRLCDQIFPLRELRALRGEIKKAIS